MISPLLLTISTLCVSGICRPPTAPSENDINYYDPLDTADDVNNHQLNPYFVADDYGYGSPSPSDGSDMLKKPLSDYDVIVVLLGKNRKGDVQTTSTTEPTGSSSNTTEESINFEQFKASNVCKENIARSCFDEADANGDGKVTTTEMRDYNKNSMARAQRLYDHYLTSSFVNADENGDGAVSKAEAEDFAENSLKIAADSAFMSFFDKMDKDGNGELSPEEFDEFMKQYYRNDPALHLTYTDYATATDMSTLSPYPTLIQSDIDD